LSTTPMTPPLRCARVDLPRLPLGCRARRASRAPHRRVVRVALWLLLLLVSVACGPSARPPVQSQPTPSCASAPTAGTPSGEPVEDGPRAAPSGVAPGHRARPERAVLDPAWVACSAAVECRLIVTRPGSCCDYGERIAVHRDFRERAQAEFGASPEQRRAAEQRGRTCADSCAPPPRMVTACRQSKCVVLRADEAPDGLAEPRAGGHITRNDDGTCTWWSSECDRLPCTTERLRVRCPVPFVPR